MICKKTWRKNPISSRNRIFKIYKSFRLPIVRANPLSFFRTFKKNNPSISKFKKSYVRKANRIFDALLIFEKENLFFGSP
jgi:hypothetical protein